MLFKKKKTYVTQVPVITESAKRKKRMERNIPNAIVTMDGRENIATRKVINHLHILYIYNSCGTYYNVYKWNCSPDLFLYAIFPVYTECPVCPFLFGHWVILPFYIATLSSNSYWISKMQKRKNLTKTELILITFNSWLSLFYLHEVRINTPTLSSLTLTYAARNVSQSLVSWWAFQMLAHV